MKFTPFHSQEMKQKDFLKTKRPTVLNKYNMVILTVNANGCQKMAAKKTETVFIASVIFAKLFLAILFF